MSKNKYCLYCYSLDVNYNQTTQESNRRSQTTPYTYTVKIEKILKLFYSSKKDISLQLNIFKDQLSGYKYQSQNKDKIYIYFVCYKSICFIDALLTLLFDCMNIPNTEEVNLSSFFPTIFTINLSQKSHFFLAFRAECCLLDCL